MPKLIDYPRTSYTSAWELADTVDDTGGKCALDTCARKLNRKVSGSFKAIVGSAVKFGLLTSKRELLTTTTLFKRIKHAYDKQEELLFHREAFLTPPLFTQLCRKFRGRELPVAMLDVLLIREFGVEEINAQVVAKAFVDGARMVKLLNETNTVADIDRLAAEQPIRRELASPSLPNNTFRVNPNPSAINTIDSSKSELAARNEPTAAQGGNKTAQPGSPEGSASSPTAQSDLSRVRLAPVRVAAPLVTQDAVASLFNLPDQLATEAPTPRERNVTERPVVSHSTPQALSEQALATGASTLQPPVAQTQSQSLESDQQGGDTTKLNPTPSATPTGNAPLEADKMMFRIQLHGPGLNTQLDVIDAEDLALVRALLNKIERSLT